VTPRLRGAIVALGAALVCGWLGTNVSEAPPAGIDLAGRAMAGAAAPLAIVFTASCRWYALVTLGIVAIVFAVAQPAWRGRVAFSVVTTLVAWQASDALKHVFGRLRPEYWIAVRETSASYPSGHAMFAVVVYGLWSYYFASSSLPRAPRFALATLCALWACGVIWSRLALGAHFVTDLAGGALFGLAMLGAAVAVYGRMPALRERSAG
jgi:undecaprenyl-diphosphatase